MAKKDTNWLGIGIIVAAILAAGGAAAIYGGAAIERGIKGWKPFGDWTPGSNLPQMPTINVSLPYNIGTGQNLEQLKAEWDRERQELIDLFPKLQPIGSGQNIDELTKFLNGLFQRNQVTPLGGTYPIVPGAQVTGSMPDITGIIAQANQAIAQGNGPYGGAAIVPTKSASEGGGGIRVENGENDYYIPDNSLYGGSSGMPVQSTSAPVSSPIVPTIKGHEAEYSKNQAAYQYGETTVIPHAAHTEAHQVTRTIFKENTDPTKARIGVMLPVTETVTEYW